MPFTLQIARQVGDPLQVQLSEGSCAFVLGANGTGKSALMHRFYTQHAQHARRITAHRQTWLPSNAVSITPKQKRDTESTLQTFDMQSSARWMEQKLDQRATIAVYELVNAENVRARNITDAVDRREYDRAETLSTKESPIRTLNHLLRLSNLPIEISVRGDEELLASKSGGPPYSISQLSDGERNALLLAATVLTARPGTLLLIDEPERHLHRSVISPLVSLLVAERPDCACVISTHDLMLPIDNPASTTLLVRSCSFTGNETHSWEVDVLEAGASVSEHLRQDILGSRHKILFVEGDNNSLDKPLYSILFPGVSVIAKGGCAEVEQAVRGIRGAHELHWVHAFGLIDNDGRTGPQMATLRAQHIYALPVHSVESIYYYPDVQRRVATRVAAVTGVDVETALALATTAAIAAVRPHVARLAALVAEKTVRDEIEQHVPGQLQIAQGQPITIQVDVSTILAAEAARLTASIAAGRLEEIITRYPVRTTPALNEIARALGLQSRSQYEDAVRTLFMDDGEALIAARGLLGPLSVAIAAA